MSIRELIADILDPESPESRPASPQNRPVEIRADAGESPESPRSPGPEVATAPAVYGPSVSVDRLVTARAAKGPSCSAEGGGITPPPLTPETREAIAEAIEERAAIREFEGGETRAVAERGARSAMRVYDLLVAMGPGEAPKSVTLLAPGCTLEDARREALGRFGAERLIEIQEHPGWR